MARHPTNGDHKLRSRIVTPSGGAVVVVVLAAFTSAVYAGAHASGTREVPAPVIRSGPPSRTTLQSALFRFVDRRRGVRFECSLDKAAFTPCESPMRYGVIEEVVKHCMRSRRTTHHDATRGTPGRLCERRLERRGTPLAAGMHTFRVRARTSVAERSRLSAFTWTIEAPVTAGSSLQAYGPAATGGTVLTNGSRPPENEEPPRVTGIPEEGQTLTAVRGTWEPGVRSFDYQWKEYVETTGSYEPIEGATSSTYRVGPLDSGHQLEVEVGATDATGTTWAISAPTASVAQLSTANIWMSPSGGSCERSSTRTAYESSKACGSMNDAEQIARCGDVIYLESGQYGEGGVEGKKGIASEARETISRGPSLTNCANQAVFEPAPGQTPEINRVTFGQEAGRTDSPSYTALNSLHIWSTVNIYGISEDNTVDHQQGGTVEMMGAHHVLVENSAFGPCEGKFHETEATEAFPCIKHADIESQEARGNLASEYVTYKHNLFHNFQGGHFECMFISGGRHILIEGNRWDNCDKEGVQFQAFPGPSGSKEVGFIEDTTFQNNLFGKMENESGEERGTALAIENIYSVNTLVRYNSMDGYDGVLGDEQNHPGNNVPVIGDIEDRHPICDEGFEYRWNIFYEDTFLQSCGLHATQYEHSTPPYVGPTIANRGEPLTENPALLPTNDPAIGYVPDEEPDDRIEWDYNGDRRTPDGPWNAGAEETR